MCRYLIYLCISVFMLTGLMLYPHATAASLPNPSSCADVKVGSSSVTDGYYTLVSNGNVFEVYCSGMNTSSPKEYIDLLHTGSALNFSFYAAGGSSYSDDGSPGVRTTFTKLRFDPATFQVDTGDFTFSESTGNTYHGYKLTQYPYAHAGGCNSSNLMGYANIDLRGLPFAVEYEGLALEGYYPYGSIDYSSNNQIVNMTANGFCGFAIPLGADELTGGGLRLVPMNVPGAVSITGEVKSIQVSGAQPNALLTLYDSSTHAQYGAAITADGSGTGRFADAPGGRAFLVTQTVGGVESTRSNVAVTVPDQVQLTAGLCSIAVSNAEPGATVKLYKNTAEPQLVDTQNADNDGRVAFTGLIPGQSYIAAQTVSNVTGLFSAEAVVLADTTPPVITLNGLNPVRIMEGLVYTDAGASAADDQDGDITNRIVASPNGGAVNTSVPGIFAVAYNVKDTAANAAIEVVRAVYVTPIPVFASADVYKIVVSGARPGAELKLYNTVTSAVYTGITADANGIGVFPALSPGQTFIAVQKVNGVESDPSPPVTVLADPTSLQPVLLSAWTDDQGFNIILTYSRAISPSLDMNKFHVSINGAPVSVSNAVYHADNPQTVTLTLSSPVPYQAAAWLTADAGAVYGVEGSPGIAGGIYVENRTLPTVTQQIYEQLKQMSGSGNRISIQHIIGWLSGHSVPDLNGDSRVDRDDVATLLRLIEPLYSGATP
ncbi:GON domain-containing protein [Paenibacillus thalictri]|uniref:DUF5011 domain-containing protein n=1 Tax=Paenibacillus thalictri TaxID=2527873 RepID=A0A4Q9DKZ9_9BACL|nr:GON domain-containing protein [Paenibacillus thalictri]TBL75043.1 DUF5011 domain-containing protein [Paenibacillus thalictri]